MTFLLCKTKKMLKLKTLGINFKSCYKVIMLKKILSFLLIISFFVPVSLAEQEIRLENPDEHKINYDEQVHTLKGSLFINDTEQAQIVVNKQQQSDVEDLENLWNATVDSNPLIKFCLKKLAIPEEQRRIHSSLMAKSVSALLSGAAMLPSFMGMHYSVQSASFAAARLANNWINRDNYKKLQDVPLTDTEAIELAALIEDLQDEIVITYYNYKGALMRLKDCRAQLLLYNKNYNEALKKNDSLEISVASAQWEEQLVEEYKIKQDVKKYHLMLERLAGKETTENLNVAQYSLKTQNVDLNDINFKKREKRS